MGRHPQMKWRTTQELGYDRVQVTEDQILLWFAELQNFLIDEVANYDELISNPKRIFNCDESGFPLQANKSRVLAQCGSRNVYHVTTPGHDQVTVLACLNAAGDYTPPFIIFKGQRLRNVCLGGFQEATYSVSKKGWMERDNFSAWLEEFSTFLDDKSIQKPVILFMDGHSSHISLQSSTFAVENGVILYCLPPHASHVMQPLDVGLFSSLKGMWRSALLDWQWLNPGQSFTKSDFPSLFKTVWEKNCSTVKASQSFLRAGLFPLNPGAIDTSRLVTAIPGYSPHVTATGIASPPSAISSDVNADCAVFTSYDSFAELDSSYAVPLHDSLSGPVSGFESLDTGSADELSPVIPLIHSSEYVGAECPIPLCTDPWWEANSSCDDSIVSITPLTVAVHVSNDAQVVIHAPESVPSASLITKRLPPNHISESVKNNLKMPEPRIKPLCAPTMPKATSGKKALQILQEIEEGKRQKEVNVIKRKLERENKKKAKQVEIEKKLKEKEIKLKEKEKKMLLKVKKEKAMVGKNGRKSKKQPAKQLTPPSSSDSDSDLPNLDESISDDFPYSEMNKEICPVCKKSEGNTADWIGCEMDTQRMHKR